jgi:cellulose biosynthesis protein BcsQ
MAKLVTFYGPSACGKTTIAAKCALGLADRGIECKVIFADLTAPPLTSLLGGPPIQTLESLLQKSELTVEEINASCAYTSARDGASAEFYGFGEGANTDIYTPHSDMVMEQWWQVFTESTDVVLIDTATNFFGQVISRSAVKCADTLVLVNAMRTTNSDWFSSNMRLVNSLRNETTEEQRVSRIYISNITNPQARFSDFTDIDPDFEFDFDLKLCKQTLKRFVLKTYNPKRKHSLDRAVGSLCEVIGADYA